MSMIISAERVGSIVAVFRDPVIGMLMVEVVGR